MACGCIGMNEAMLHLVLLDQPLEAFGVQHGSGGDHPCSLKLLHPLAALVVVPSGV